VNQITEAKRSGLSAALNLPYLAYCAVTFVALGLAALALILLLPNLRRRRAVARACSRAFLWVAGIRLSVEGLELLPATPCVVVANHASYIDAIVMAGALPPDFAFVIKKEMANAPLAGLLLRRLGSQFVERFDRNKGAADARRVLKLAASGQSLMFFPEGTFDETARIGKFLGGAFATALRSDMPVVAVAIHGSRAVFPPGRLAIHPLPIRVQILQVLGAENARLRCRELIAGAVGEPLA
jgi:1-acyl-sn-glycerol-3-phosphate acyltransferase